MRSRSRAAVSFLRLGGAGVLLCIIAGAAMAESDASGSASRFFLEERQRLLPDASTAPHHSRPALPRPSRAAVSHQFRPPVVAASAAHKPPSLVVAVYGDRLGQALARGLEDDAADWMTLQVSASEDAGLSRSDFPDWLASIRAKLEKPDRPAVAVLLIGSNDRQPILDGGTQVEPGTDRWQSLYAARIDAVAALFRDTHVPLVWVGLPTVRGADVSADFVRLNAMYRDRAGRAAATFVDNWEAFSDETGSYSPIGPDIEGRIVKLRKADGFGFTRAGARKLASFVEADIKRLQKLPPQAPDTAPQVAMITIEKGSDFDQALDIDVNAQIQREAGLVAGAALAVAKPAAPAAGPVVSLTSAPLSPDGVLASATLAQPGRQAGLVANAAERSTEPSTPKPGRSDDFAWPKP